MFIIWGVRIGGNGLILPYYALFLLEIDLNLYFVGLDKVLNRFQDRIGTGFLGISYPHCHEAPVVGMSSRTSTDHDHLLGKSFYICLCWDVHLWSFSHVVKPIFAKPFIGAEKSHLQRRRKLIKTMHFSCLASLLALLCTSEGSVILIWIQASIPPPKPMLFKFPF